jgi:hypothetical protein
MFHELVELERMAHHVSTAVLLRDNNLTLNAHHSFPVYSPELSLTHLYAKFTTIY